MTANPTVTHHEMTRLDIPTGMAFEAFRIAFERVVPIFDGEVVTDITSGGGTWEDVRAAVARNAPNGLMIFASIDATPLMAAAGHHTKAVEYLVGNHVIAERMFAHDPKALLYAPLRILVHGDQNGEAVFTLDQPSAAFGSLGIPEITDVGRELDQRVAAILLLVGVPAVAALESDV